MFHQLQGPEVTLFALAILMGLATHSVEITNFGIRLITMIVKSLDEKMKACTPRSSDL